MDRSLWRTALLEVRWRSDASKPVYLQMARAMAEGIQTPGHVVRLLPTDHWPLACLSTMTGHLRMRWEGS
jgi:hypothetical protein